MEAKRVCVLFFVLAIWAVDYADCASHHGHVHAPAPAPSVDCSSLILNMADCLSFVSNGSTATKPEGTCCSGLGTVLKAGPQCLCEAFKSSAQLGVVLDVPKALSLPTACKLPVSKATDCGLTAPPTAAPALSPGSSTTGGSTTGSSPSSSSKSSASSPIPVSAGVLVLAIGLAVVSFFGF